MSQEEARRVYTVATCPKCLEPSWDASVCSACGEVFDEEDVLDLLLSFAAERCPGCDVAQPAGPCPDCGAIVPEPSEPNGATRARRKIFAPFEEQAYSLRAEFDHVHEANITVTSAQYATAIADANVLGRVGDVIDASHRLNALDLSDGSVISGVARAEVETSLASAGRLLEAVQAFAWFRPTDDFDGFRDQMLAVGRHGADLVCSLVDTLRAETVERAVAAAGTFQALISNIPSLQRIKALLETSGVPEADDVDERVSLALGVPGQYTDEYGALDLSRLFTGAGAIGPPFDVMARGAVDFFAHLLPRGRHEFGPQAALLAIAALPLSALDRPLQGHRIAVHTTRLLNHAYERDSTAVTLLLTRTARESERAMAAAIRILRDARRLAHDPNLEAQDVVANTLVAYKRLSESSFRTHAALVRDLIAIVSGRSFDASEIPTVGLLVRALNDSSNRELAPLLVQAIDIDLRNAEAHEDFLIDRDGVAHFDGGSVDPVSLEAAAERLIAAAAGLEAAALCFSFERGLDEVFASSEVARSAAVLDQISAMFLGAYGFDLISVAVHDNELDLVVSPPDSDTPLFRPLPALIPIADQMPDIEVFRLLADEGEVLLEVSADYFRRWKSAPDAMRDFETLFVLRDVLVRRGAEPKEALQQMLAGGVTLLVANAVEAHWSRSRLRRIEKRTGHLVRAVSPLRGEMTPESQAVVQRLRSVRSDAKAAAGGDLVAKDRVGRTFAALIDWADEQDRSLFTEALG